MEGFYGTSTYEQQNKSFWLTCEGVDMYGDYMVHPLPPIALGQGPHRLLAPRRHVLQDLCENICYLSKTNISKSF